MSPRTVPLRGAPLQDEGGNHSADRDRPTDVTAARGCTLRDRRRKCAPGHSPPLPPPRDRAPPPLRQLLSSEVKSLPERMFAAREGATRCRHRGALAPPRRSKLQPENGREDAFKISTRESEPALAAPRLPTPRARRTPHTARRHPTRTADTRHDTCLTCWIAHTPPAGHGELLGPPRCGCVVRFLARGSYHGTLHPMCDPLLVSWLCDTRVACGVWRVMCGVCCLALALPTFGWPPCGQVWLSGVSSG